MGEKTGRGKLVITTAVLFVVIAGALAFIAAQFGTSRALAVAIALAVIAILVGFVLSIVSVISAVNAKRTPDPTFHEQTNTQRPVARRGPIIADEQPPPGERRTGHRRKNPDA